MKPYYLKESDFKNSAVSPDTALAKYWCDKGCALNSQGKYDEAIEAYDEAIRLDPDSAEAWNNKGDAGPKTEQIR